MMSEPLAESVMTEAAAEAGTVGTQKASNEDHTSEDSSSDSGGESGSSSGDGSSSSRSSSGSEQTPDEVAQRGEQSDGQQSDDVQGDRSVDESFKSVAPVASEDDVEASPELNVTPGRLQPIDQPVRASVKELEDRLPVASSAQSGPFKLPGQAVQSPIPVTPAKQLEWADLLSTIEAPAKIMDVTEAVNVTPKGPLNHLMSPGELFSSPTAVPVATRVVKEVVKADKDPTSRLQSSPSRRKASPTKHAKHSRTKKSKHHKDRAVKRVEENVRQLQLEVDEIRSLKAKLKLEANKRRLSGDGRHKKTKKMKTTSSDEVESSESSSAVEPSSSNRISRIPNGRKYQRISMSRAKQLGVIVLVDSRVALVSNAAKVVTEAVLKPLPVHAYELFHQVPGTGLLHIKKLVRDLQERYAPFLVATAKLHLGLSMEYRQSRSKLVVPDEGSPFMSIWLAENDLTRASEKPDVEIGQLESAAVGRFVGADKPGPSSAVVALAPPLASVALAVSAPVAPQVAVVERRVLEASKVEEPQKAKSRKKKKKDSKDAKVKHEAYLLIRNWNFPCLLLTASNLLVGSILMASQANPWSATRHWTIDSSSLSHVQGANHRPGASSCRFRLSGSMAEVSVLRPPCSSEQGELPAGSAFFLIGQLSNHLTKSID